MSVQGQNREAQANREAQSQRVNNLGLRRSQDQPYISSFDVDYEERMELRISDNELETLKKELAEA